MMNGIQKRNVLALSAALGAAVMLFGCDRGLVRDINGDDGVTQRPEGIPGWAKKVGEGRAARADFVAPEDGTVYVYNETADRLVWSGPVRGTAMVTIDPTADAVLINDQQVPGSSQKASLELPDVHLYEMYFSPTQRK